MGFKLVTDEKGTKVYRKERETKNGGKFSTYCAKVSNKDKDGNWQSAFMDIFFKKGVEVNDKAVINIKNAFPVLNTYNGKSTIRWCISEFDVLESGESNNGNDDFMSIPDGVDDDSLPFD